jgi:hypothetical protein
MASRQAARSGERVAGTMVSTLSYSRTSGPPRGEWVGGRPLGIGQVPTSQKHQANIGVADEGSPAVALGPEEIAGAVEQFGSVVQVTQIGVVGDTMGFASGWQ